VRMPSNNQGHLYRTGIALVALCVLAFGIWFSRRTFDPTPPPSGDRDSIEIVRVWPASPRPGGSLLVEVDPGHESEGLALTMGGRSVDLVVRLDNRLLALVPEDAALGHHKLRVATSLDRSKPAHIELTSGFPTEQVSGWLGGIALVLFGMTSLGKGLARSLGSNGARLLARAFASTGSSVVTGLMLGLLVGREVVFGAGLILALAGLELAGPIALGSSLAGLLLASQYAIAMPPLIGIAGLWLIAGLWFSIEARRRRLRGVGALLVGLGSLSVGAALLRGTTGMGLQWLDQAFWDTVTRSKALSWDESFGVLARGVLFGLSEQHTRAIEDLLTYAAAARGNVAWAAAALWWVGTTFGVALLLSPFLFAGRAARQAVGIALAWVTTAAVLLCGVSPLFSRAVAWTPLSQSALVVILLGVLFVGLRGADWFGRFRRHARRLAPAPSATSGSSGREAISTGISNLMQALELLCRAIRSGERDDTERVEVLLHTAREHLERAARFAQGGSEPQIAVAASHALAMYQGLATACKIVDRWTDTSIMNRALGREAAIPEAAERALGVIESQLLTGLRGLVQALASSSEVSVEEALQREILVHASAQPGGVLNGPIAPYVIAFLQSLALVGHELYHLSELFGDDPVAPGRLALMNVAE
jgi:hypothetical protein